MKHGRARRLGVAAVAILCVGLAGGCGLGTPSVPEADVPVGSMTSYPEIPPIADQVEREYREAALYFRMRGEGLLARETREVVLSRDRQLAYVLIEALLEGPDAGLLDLTSVFAPGTRVLEVAGEGTLLMVTLSRSFLDAPPDAPGNWRQDAAWREETLLRRRLALLSIVTTVTEATEYTAVQFFVAPAGDGGAGQRIARSELYQGAAADELLTPMTRDETLLLTAHNTAKVVLECLMSKDFTRLHRFIWGAPTEAAFEQEIVSLGRSLTGHALSPGMVAEDGQGAVLTADLEYADGNGVVSIQGYPLKLVQENGLWRMRYEALLRLMEAM